MRTKLFIVGIIVLFILSTSVFATNTTLTPSIGNGKDKYCLEDCDNSAELVITNNHSLSSAYVSFDLSSIPENADISIAVLLFKLKSSDPYSDDIAKFMTVNGAWQEDDNQKPISDTYIGMLNNYSCGTFCNNEVDWVGVSGTNLINAIYVMIAGTNNGFVIRESNINFSVYSSESTGFSPVLFLEYEANCADADNDGFGYGDCSGELDCNDTNSGINPNATEICNYIDDDCNLLIDDTGYDCKTCNQTEGYICSGGEFCKTSYIDVLDTNSCCIDECEIACVEGDTKECGNDTGICRIGYQVCHKKEWSKCINDSVATTEYCNNLDDDCNGVIDDTDKFYFCGCYNGSSPSIEIYDEIDNDCDREIDENTTCEERNGFECISKDNCGETLITGTDVDFCCSQECSNDCISGKTKPCGINIGLCKEGIITCENALWGECQGATLPINETCNNVDDDCDGFVDNIIDTSKCMCFNSKPIEELCNEMDDDCNGEIDENCTQIDVACTDGIKNYNEEKIDCGGFCSGCENDNGSSQTNPNNNNNMNNSKLDPVITTTNPDDNDESFFTFNKIMIFLLIFVAITVIGIVVFEIFHSKKSNQNLNQLYNNVNNVNNNNSGQQNSPYSPQQFHQSRPSYVQKPSFAPKKINSYDAKLNKPKDTTLEAKKLRDKINNTF
jgi:hypothetical protein